MAQHLKWVLTYPALARQARSTMARWFQAGGGGGRLDRDKAKEVAELRQKRRREQTMRQLLAFKRRR